VSEYSAYNLSLPCMRLDHDFVYMQKTCSVAILNMGIKLVLKLVKQQVFFLLCLYLICAEYEFETFGATSDEIR